MFAVEKLVTSKLYEKGANRRIFNIDSHIGMVNTLFHINSHNNNNTFVIYTYLIFD